MKVWFITGASRGFGRRIAELALARGDKVVAAARDAEVLRNQFGGHPNVLPVRLDVTDEAEAQAAFQLATETHCILSYDRTFMRPVLPAS